MHTSPEQRRWRPSGKRLCAALSTMAITVTAAGVIPPASATLVDSEPIAADRNITVFHNIDFIGAFGWPAGEDISVDVLRNGVVIGSATGPSVDLGEEGTALEVNHGPEVLPPAAGDCWTGHTPDVRPGDQVRVTHNGVASSVLVDNITFSGPPTEEVVTPGVNGDIVVKGVAKFADGSNIPLAALDSSEFRDTSKFRGGPNSVEVDPAVDGGFVLRYNPPYIPVGGRNENNLNEAQRKTSLLGDGHATGFGHTEVLPAESMLVDGIADVPGPALGCEAAPSAQHVVTSVNTAKAGFLNAADIAAAGDLTVSGAATDATGVSVQVGSLDPVDADVADGVWTASVPRADLAGQPEGPLTISMVSATATGDVSGVSKILTKDTLAPSAPTASPMPADVGIGTANVTLAAGAGDTVRYNLGGADQLYAGAFPIASDATLTATATDDAGNTSQPFSAVYDITQAVGPARPTLGRVTAGNASATASWTPGSAGSSAIRGYTLRAYRGNALAKTVTLGNVRRATVRGLVNGASYRFKVSARNSETSSFLSAFSNTVRPQTVSSSPRRVRALRNAPGGRVTAAATWLAPRSNGGASISRYEVRASLVRANGSLARPRVVASRPGRARAATVTLRRGTYRFSVRAVNNAGHSAWSALSNARQAR